MNVRTAAVRIAGPVVGAAVLATAIGVGTANASTTAPYIHNGTHGVGAECVQAGLNYADNAGLTVDGVDGALTTAAVKTFQRRNGLSVDGIVGPATGDILWRDILADEASSTPYIFCGLWLPTTS